MTTKLAGTSGDDYFLDINNDNIEYYSNIIDEYGSLIIYYKIEDSSLIYGLSGDDTINLSRSGNAVVYAGSGNDSVYSPPEGTPRIYLGTGDDLFVSEDSSHAVVHGGSGNDTFETEGYKKDLYGESGNDSFSIFYSIDIYAGNSKFNGGSGIDTIEYIILLESNSGININLDKKWGYRLDDYNDTTSQRDTLIGFENATGTEGDDSLVGNAVGNVLSGLAGMDILKGLGGNDTLISGGNSYDIDWRPDRLSGGTGNDVLVAGDGVDILQGGTGRDTFRFAEIDRTDRPDRILDFSHLQKDHIDLSGIDANTLKTGDQKFAFLGSDPFTKTAGELNFRGGLLSGDIDGDGNADFQIKLVGVTSVLKSALVL